MISLIWNQIYYILLKVSFIRQLNIFSLDFQWHAAMTVLCMRTLYTQIKSFFMTILYPKKHNYLDYLVYFTVFILQGICQIFSETRFSRTSTYKDLFPSFYIQTEFKFSRFNARSIFVFLFFSKKKSSEKIINYWDLSFAHRRRQKIYNHLSKQWVVCVTLCPLNLLQNESNPSSCHNYTLV